MATNVEEQQLQGIVCPLCLDVFKNATILSCGHTFCKGCLEAYDEQYQHDHIVCPVCRESTYLGHNRIAGLTPNFLARGIQDKLHVVASSQSFCPLHKSTHDIFCEECKEFICFTCFIDNHKDHKIKKREVLEEDLKDKVDSLIRESEVRKAQIEVSVNNAQQRRTDTRSHFCKVETKIKDEFAKRVTILQQKEELLLNKLDRIRKETENQYEVCIGNQRQAIDDINNSTTILREYTGKNVDLNAIKTRYLQCSELEKSLKRSIDEASIVRLKQTAESTRFHPSDEKFLALGHIEVGVKETSNVQQVKTTAGTNRKSEHQLLQTKRKLRVTPAPARSKALNIVREVKVTSKISGMAAQSQDAVVVGYGLMRHGSDRFSVSGEMTQHLKSKVGNVWDIAFLTDGRSVVSHGFDHRVRLYSTDGHRAGMQYTCKIDPFIMSIITLCVDQDDNIYAVNGNPEIYIFHGSNPKPRRVIRTGKIIPLQICVTKTGAMITRSSDNSLDTVTVFDREGHVGNSITASIKERLHVAVDSQDRVLVARVGSVGQFRLSRYILQGTTPIQQVAFNELKLPSVPKYSYGCMVSLELQLIAFSHENHLHFIKLDE